MRQRGACAPSPDDRGQVTEIAQPLNGPFPQGREDAVHRQRYPVRRDACREQLAKTRA
jgi:hypothetical protein